MTSNKPVETAARQRLDVLMVTKWKRMRSQRRRRVLQVVWLVVWKRVHETELMVDRTSAVRRFYRLFCRFVVKFPAYLILNFILKGTILN